MENKLQNLKFRVYSEEHSKAIQEKLFEVDKEIKWVITTSMEVDHLDSKYIYLDCYKYLSIGNLDEKFIHCPYKESTLDDLYKIQSEPTPQSELMTKLESLQKELDSVKEEISKLNK